MALIALARRFAWLGLLGSAFLWICWFADNTRTFLRSNCEMDKNVFCADHMAFYTAARLMCEGHADKVYDYVFVSDYQHKLFYRDPANHDNDVWTMLEAFRNPPFYAVLYYPTCQQPYFISMGIWVGISALLTTLGTYLLGGRWVWNLLWVFSFLPTFAAFDYGQNTPISYLLFAATYVLLKKQRPFAAGLVAGLLLFKPQLLLGLGIWAVLDIRTKWPCALGVIITGLLLATYSWHYQPVATQGFIQSFNSNLQFESFQQHKMHNPLAFIRLLLPISELGDERWVRLMHNGFAASCSLAALAAFVTLWWHRGRDLNVMFGGVVFLTLFAGPHALIYEWMLLAITGILWSTEWKDRPNTWYALYAATWGTLYFSTDLSAEMLNLSPVVFQCSVPVLAVVGLYSVKLLISQNAPLDPKRLPT